MEITLHGKLLIPLGLVLFAVFPRWLYNLTIISIPFTATSLLNSASGVPLSPLQYFGLLFIGHQTLSCWCRGLKIRSPWGSAQWLLTAFLVAVMASMIMPFIIDGSLSISSNQINDLFEEPLRLNSHNIKNPLPVIFGILLAHCIICKNDSAEKIYSTIRLYVLTGLLVSIWGILQFTCASVLQVEYPYYIFNNAVLEAMQGYTSKVEIGGLLYPRVSSVTHEASIFAKYLLTIYALVLSAVWMKRPLFGIWRDRFLVCLLVGTLAITLSSTAYLGVVCTTIITGGLLLGLNMIGWRWFLWAGLFGAFVLLLYAQNSLFSSIVDTMIFTKHESGSAEERWLSNTNSWGYFCQYPILGVGWATVTVHGLLVYLLANSGLLGFTIFGLLVYTVLRQAWGAAWSLHRSARKLHQSRLVLLVGMISALLILVIMGILTGLEFYLGYIYFICGSLVASAREFRQDKTRRSIEDVDPLQSGRTGCGATL